MRRKNIVTKGKKEFMHKSVKYVLIGLVAVVGLGAFLLSCDGNNDDNNSASSGGPPPPVSSAQPPIDIGVPDDNEPSFGAPRLSGANEVPPTNSQTTGTVIFRVRRDKNGIARSIDYVDEVRNGVALRQSHFHCAPTGVNGPVVAFMAGRHDGGVNVSKGVWVRGNLTDNAISSTGTGITNPVTCATANPAVAGAVIATIDDLVQQAKAGNIYVCYHDATFPNGAIRAQVSLRDVNDKFKDKDDRDTRDDT